MGGNIGAMLQQAGQRMGGQGSTVQDQMYRPPAQNPFYDPYTAARRPNYSPFGPNQQFYQPIYRPSYDQFSPFSQFQQPVYSQPMFSPQPVQSQFRPVPYMNMTQLEAKQAAAAPPAPSYDGGGGFKQGGAVDEGIASLLRK